MRMRNTVVCGLVVGLLMGLGVVGLAEETTEMYNVGLSDSVTQAVEDTFAEKKNLTSEIVDASGVFAIEQETSISMTFVGEGAGYKNQVGFFTFDNEGAVLSQTVVFENFSGTGKGLAGGGSLNAGDTFDIGTFEPGENVGFFLVANGFNRKNAPSWYTISALNSDGKDHDAVMETEDGTLIGFEDLKNLGDRDYNDALMFVTTVVTEPVLDETVAEGDVSQASAPSATDLAAQGVASLLGLSDSDAREIVLEYGPIVVNRALEYAADGDEFWSSVLGYDVLGELTAAGGGGTVDSGTSGYLVSVQLRSPITGEPVTTEHISLTIVESPSNIVDIVVVPFVEATGSYTFDLRSVDLAPGVYDLYLGFENGTHHLMTLIVPTLG